MCTEYSGFSLNIQPLHLQPSGLRVSGELSEPVRGRKRGPKSSGNGNMEESPKIVSSFRNGEAAALTQYVVGSSCLK
uniref:Uncharacterized protein n=1 Tax=Leersia perrieri TaxID=77586 RepID=A0A0D9W564_9ORYZ